MKMMASMTRYGRGGIVLGFWLIFVLGRPALVAQSGIGINVSTPHPSAALHIQATDKGILIPRMTQAQRLAIDAPVPGLLVLQVNNTPGFFYRTDTGWERLGGYSSRLVDLDTDTDVDLEKTIDDDMIRFRADQVNALTISRNFYGRTLVGLPSAAGQHTFVGKDAGTAVTTAVNLTALGDSALALTTTGLWATALGLKALRLNTTGAYNAALGLWALTTNATGSRNTAIGHSALSASTSSELTAIGYNSLASNTTGARNTAIGFSALLANTTGSDNTAIGHEALKTNMSGGGNTALGHAALRLNTTGMDNTAIGKGALEDNDVGQQNTATGYRALADNLIGDRNTAAGAGSLQALLAGDDNTAIGFEAMATKISGDENTGIGFRALHGNTSGMQNTAIGYEAQRLGNGARNASVGFRTLENLTSGSENTAIGSGALNQVTSGYRNLAVGAGADVSDGTLSHATAIGANAYVEKSNALILGSVAGLNNATITPRLGIGTPTPHPGALVDVTSTNKAVLLPRMTNAQRNAIPDPANGLLVYSTTSHSPWMFNGVYWENAEDPIGFLNADPGESLRFYDYPISDDEFDDYYPAFPSHIADADGNSKLTAFGETIFYTDHYLHLQLDGEEAFSLQAAAPHATARMAVEWLANDYNLFIGHFAGNVLDEGFDNTVVGKRALEMASTANETTAIGAYALQVAESSHENTAIGDHALDALTSGYNNVAIGQDALGGCTICRESVAVGYKAMASVTTGRGFFGLGAFADVGPQAFNNAGAIGARAYVNASDAIVLGSRAGVNGATADVNVGIGVTAPGARLHVRINPDIPSTSTHLMLEDVEAQRANIHFVNNTGNSGWELRATPRPNPDNAQLDFYYAAADQMTVKGNGDLIVAGTLAQNSDVRLKTDIQPIRFLPAILDSLRGYHFQWQDTLRGEALQSGLIAQEVEKQLPHLVTTSSDGMKGVHYGGLLPELLEAIKVLDQAHRERQALIEANETMIRALEAMITDLEEQ